MKYFCMKYPSCRNIIINKQLSPHIQSPVGSPVGFCLHKVFSQIRIHSKKPLKSSNSKPMPFGTLLAERSAKGFVSCLPLRTSHTGVTKYENGLDLVGHGIVFLVFCNLGHLWSRTDLLCVLWIVGLAFQVFRSCSDKTREE